MRDHSIFDPEESEFQLSEQVLASYVQAVTNACPIECEDDLGFDLVMPDNWCEYQVNKNTGNTYPCHPSRRREKRSAQQHRAARETRCWAYWSRLEGESYELVVDVDPETENQESEGQEDE